MCVTGKGNGLSPDEGKSFIPDLLNRKSEFLFSFLGKDGERLSHEFRCLFLVLALYLPGLVTTSLTGSLNSFISTGWGFLLSTIFIGLFIWLLVGFLKKLGGKIENVNRIIFPGVFENDNADEFGKTNDDHDHWPKKLKNYKNWISEDINKWPKWYYSQALITAMLGLIISAHLLRTDAIGWAKDIPVNELYFMVWFTFLGFLTGVSLYYIEFCFYVIRRYCRDVITEDDILPLDPDRTGGLRELGRISLDLDLIVALPSMAFLIYVPQKPDIFIGRIGIVSVILTTSYTLFLIFVFFITLSPVHERMAQAKLKYLAYIHKEYRELHEELLSKLKQSGKKLQIKDYGTLKGLYELYDRAESMSVWPLDYRIMLRFLLTSILPIVIAVISTQINVYLPK